MADWVLSGWVLAGGVLAGCQMLRRDLVRRRYFGRRYSGGGGAGVLVGGVCLWLTAAVIVVVTDGSGWVWISTLSG